MQAIIGEIMFFFGIIYFYVILITARNPEKKVWWVKPMLNESVHMLVIMGSWVLGPTILIKGMVGNASIKALTIDAIFFVVLLSVTIVTIKSMRINQRLAEFSAKNEEKKYSNITDITPPTSDDSGETPHQRAA